MSDLRLLYVEDEADIREVARIALEDEGFELLFCASGQEALEQAQAFRPDLIMLDVMMPVMDGKQTLKQLRGLQGLEHVPIIFLTAKVHPEEVRTLRALGAIDVIPKPFDPMSLADLIKTIWSDYHRH